MLDGLQIEGIDRRVLRPLAKARVVIEGHADQVADRVLGLLGEFLLDPYGLRARQ